MSEQKMMTEVQALRNALAGVLDDATVEKLEHMIEVRSRKHARKADTSKRDANIELGKKFAELWAGGEFKASDVAATLEVSTSKASAIARACEWAEVESTEKVKVYTLA